MDASNYLLDLSEELIVLEKITREMDNLHVQLDEVCWNINDIIKSIRDVKN